MTTAPAIEIIVEGRAYNASEVARLVFHKDKARWFLENRRRLERETGFPRPVSPFGRPCWAGADLLAWMARDKAVESRRPARGLNVLNLRERALAVAEGRI